MSLENPMPRSSVHEEMHPAMVLVILLCSIVFCLMIGSGIMLWLVASNGLAFDDIAGMLTDSSTTSDRNLFRSTILIQHLTMFVIPSLVTAFIVYKSDWVRQLWLDKLPSLGNWGLGALLIFAAFPLVQFTYWLNQQLPLPDWALAIEADTQEAIMQMLKTDASYELIFNVFIIAVIPAIGEELVFRGFLQNKLGDLFKNQHLAVWVAAIIFSGFHMQFEGFIPRMLLGALLGYLLVWTKNLWVPIIAHFINNGFQVLAQFLYAEEMSSIDLEEVDQVNIPLTLLSVVLVGFLGHRLWQRNKRLEESI